MSNPNNPQRVSFGDSSRILREGNIEKFLPLVSKEEILEKTLNDKLNPKDKISIEERKAIADIFQSITFEAKLTKEIIKEINKLPIKSKRKIAEYFKIVYTTSGQEGGNKVEKSPLLLDKSSNEYGIHSSGAQSVNNKENYKIEDLCRGFYSNNSLISSISNVKDLNFVNKEKEPSKQYPHFSGIMINDPAVRSGLKNSLEMSTFLNVVNTTEFSRAYPFFNAFFILPSKVNKNQDKKFKTASMNQFLFGGSTTGDNASFIAKSFESNIIKRKKKFDINDQGQLIEGEIELEGVQSNMSLFTSPQTMINANEKKGHFDSIKAIIGDNYDRGATPRDTMLPFMSLKEFNIDVSPTRGLMSYKTGTMTVTLHDKNRMIDIAPLIKPDLFGAFGAEIVVEYGWSHPDANVRNSNNKIGEFIDSSRCIEKYMIVNSSYTIENSGIVNISLSLAAKGPVMFKLIEILKTPEYANFNAQSEKINQNIQNDITRIGQALGSPGNDQIRLSLDSISSFDISDVSDSIADGKISKIPDEILGQMKTFNERFSVLENSNILFVATAGTTAKFSKSSPGNTLLKSFGFNYKQDAIPISAFEPIKSLSKNVKLLMKLYNLIIEDQKIMTDHTNIFLKSILGGTILEDPYYDQGLGKELNVKINRNISQERPKYVSLGSILSAIIGNYFLNGVNNSVDEVQLVFYTANKYSARMRNRNIASILVDTDELEDLLLNVLSKNNRVITIESLISHILKEIVHKKNNITYGLSKINSEIKKVEDSVEDDEAKKRKKEELFSKQENILKNIYPRGEDLKFVVPNIHFIFDSLTNKRGNGVDTTICRISIYDRHDNPFDTLKSIIEEYTGYGALLKKNNKIAELKREGLRGKISKQAFEKREVELRKELENDGIIEKNGNSYKLSSKKDFSDIKKFIRNYIPYTKIGTQNSGIINATLTTINEGKLLTTFLTRPDRNNDLIETRVRTELPLRVMPSQASVELFGCPWVQFNQMLFLDFGTETSVDNQYIVTGISHQISPGKFTTSLKLSYGDFYGPVENAVNNITDLINKKLVERLEARKLISEEKFEYANYTSSNTGVLIDEAYQDVINNPIIYKDFIERAGFVYDEAPENITDQEGNQLRLKIPLKTEKFRNPFLTKTKDKEALFEKREQDKKDLRQFVQIGLKQAEKFLIKYKYNHSSKKILISTERAAQALIELVIKYYLVFGFDKKIKITDNFRERYRGSGDIPDAGNGHRLAVAFDILTSSFYSSSISKYTIQDGKLIESDQQGQERMNVFYEIAKSVGFTNFGIGNGTLHIDMRTDRSNKWIYNYNIGTDGKKGTDHSEYIGSGHKKSIDLWSNDPKIFSGSYKKWIRDVWNSNKDKLGLSGFGNGSYDYLPYEFKKIAGIDNTIDKEFNINNVRTNYSTQTLEDEIVKIAGFNNVFYNKFSIKLSSFLDSELKSFLGENEQKIKEAQDDNAVAEFLIENFWTKVGLSKFHVYFDHDFEVAQDCKILIDENNNNSAGVKSKERNEAELISKLHKFLKFNKASTKKGEKDRKIKQHYQNFIKKETFEEMSIESFILDETTSGGIFKKMKETVLGYKLNITLDYRYEKPETTSESGTTPSTQESESITHETSFSFSIIPVIEDFTTYESSINLKILPQPGMLEKIISAIRNKLNIAINDERAPKSYSEFLFENIKIKMSYENFEFPEKDYKLVSINNKNLTDNNIEINIIAYYINEYIQKSITLLDTTK